MKFENQFENAVKAYAAANNDLVKVKREAVEIKTQTTFITSMIRAIKEDYANAVAMDDVIKVDTYAKELTTHVKLYNDLVNRDSLLIEKENECEIRLQKLHSDILRLGGFKFAAPLKKDPSTPPTTPTVLN